MGMPKVRAGAIALGLLTLLACFGTPSPPPNAPLPVHEPDFVAARAVIQRLEALIIDVSKNAKELGYAGRYERLAPAVREIFDVRSMARGTLGEHWPSLTPEQQNEWVTLFTRFHTSALADEHRSYRGQTFVNLGERRDERGLVLVSVLLDFPGRNVDVRTDYRLRNTNRGWLVVDIHQPPAVSEVAMRRAEYATVYEAGGFEKIVERMQKAIARRAERSR